MTAIEFDQRTEGLQHLPSALIRFCNKVDHRRRTGTSSSIEQFAWQLLEVAAEARPSATQAVDQLASIMVDHHGLEEVPEGSRDHHGLEVSSTQPDLGHVADGSHAESKVSQDHTKPADTETPMGPRGGEQQDDATGAEASHDASAG